MSLKVSAILGIILTVIAVVAAYIFVIPERRVKYLNKFLYIIHNIFNFKQLLIEKIVKFFYVFLTILCICLGFFMLFTVEFGQSFFGIGLGIMIGGPIVLRLLFESFMMMILITNNIIELNKKTPAKPAARAQRPAPRPAAPRYESTSYNPYGE